MHQIRNLIFILCTGFFWQACADEFDKNDQLQKVIGTVDRNPQEALQVLEDMTPEFLGKDEFMCYVVMLAQARYMDNQDITGDTLILEAQRYFAGSHNQEMSARASYYAACFWHQQEAEEKALENSLLAHHFAQLAGNNFFMAKSAHWIGSTYYDLALLDSAQVYYQKALELYEQEPNTELHILGLVNMLGRICLELEQLDQASIYFVDGLEAARELHNTGYEALFLQNRGIVCRESKEYEEAKVYFGQALSVKPNTEDSLRIYLSYAKLCRMSSQPDSTKHYLDLVKNRIAEIHYPYTRRLVYRELVSYYKSEGSIHEMERFLKLKNKEELNIKELQNEEKTHAARSRFEQYKQEVERRYITTLKIGLTSVIVMGFLLLIFGFDRHKMKESYEKLRSQNLDQKMDSQNSLIGSLKSLSKSADAICADEKSITTVSVRRQLLPLRAKFSVEFAMLSREVLIQFPHGEDALQHLTSEDLCIIYLTKLNYPDESISWMLGYEKYSKFYMDSRKREIRRRMVNAGMKENDIQTIFPW